MRIFYILSVASLILSCSPYQYVFVSRCGSYVSGPPDFPLKIQEVTEDGQDGWSEEKYNLAESAAVRHLATVKDERFKDACGMMAGVHVRILPTRVWDYHGTTVAGQTLCMPDGYRLVYIGNSMAYESALPHEMAHVIEGCSPNGTRDLKMGEDADHAGWHAKGIYNASSWYYSELYSEGK